MKKLKLEGQRYGKLVVVKAVQNTKDNKSRFLCKCDCGVEKIIRGVVLRKGKINSCGCNNRLDLTGMKFNRLTVLKMVGVNKHKKSLCKCKCDCDTIKTLLATHIMSGRIKSCGCLQTENRYCSKLTKEEQIDRREIPGYEKWRNSVYERNGYTCQKCGDDKGGNLNAHHIESYNSSPELRTEVSNGITLCEDCHKDFHHQYGYGDNTRAQLVGFLK